jgi:formate-dependent nitrite reductase membrane component NrfD
LRLVNGFIELLHDAAGIPFALLIAGYTGVLLSSTANPLWSRNKWLGPLFSAGAVATGAAATSLAVSLTARGGGKERSHKALERVDTAAHLVEAACLAGFMKEAGPKADALRRAKMKGWHKATIGGLILSELLKLLPLPRRAKRTAGVLSSLLSLFSGFALRWAMVHGGREAANDPHTARLSSRPKPR